MKLTPINPSDTGLRALVLWDADGTVTYGDMPAGIESYPGYSGGIYIRRVRERCSLYIISATATATVILIPLPQGTRPAFPFVRKPFQAMDKVTGSYQLGSSAITMELSTPGRLTPLTFYALTMEWDVYGAFPTVFPGLPA